MQRWSYVLKIALSVVAVVVFGFLISRFRLSSADVAPAFDEARTKGAAISDTIATLSNEVSADLAQVNTYDSEGQSREALDLTIKVRVKVQEIKVQAAELSEQLKNMVAGLDGIRSASARQAALDAITHRMALISRLMSYSEYLDQLMQVLSHHFIGTPDPANVQAIITQINAEVTAINTFNEQAHQAMERFEDGL